MTHVEQRIVNFVRTHVKEHLAGLNDQTFEGYREAFVHRKLEKLTSVDYGKKYVTKDGNYLGAMTDNIKAPCPRVAYTQVVYFVIRMYLIRQFFLRTNARI